MLKYLILFLISLSILPASALTPSPKIPQVSATKVVKPAPAWESVKVIKVYDGDTFTVTRNGEPVRIRVTWVNTPELKTKQFYSQEAKDILSSALTNGDVEVQVVGKSFDRLVAHVRTEKIQNVGLYLVQQGAGVAYPTCSRACPESWKIVQNAEAIAKRSKMGIWQQSVDLNQSVTEV